jgi:hypothetical protein
VDGNGDWVKYKYMIIYVYIYIYLIFDEGNATTADPMAGTVCPVARRGIYLQHAKFTAVIISSTSGSGTSYKSFCLNSV